ncbi:MAG: leucine-rich repeat domain-containing protein, partial [Oscillospiraceae bacterium]|nr:leucine-rich repeat domain-containing protein [Oscillospiraceae bacterium]
ALTSVSIPDSVTAIGSYSFDGCTALTSITIPGNVTSIDERAFTRLSESNLTSIAFGEGTTKIAFTAFSNCKKLSALYLPKSLTQVIGGAFYYCNDITDIYYAGNPKDKQQLVIGANNDALVYSATWHYNSDY